MSSKSFQRKDLKHDQFVIGAGRIGHWLMERRRRIGWAVLAVAVVLSVVFSVRFAHQRQEQQAAALLGAAMDVYRAPVVPPAPESVAMPVADAGEGTPPGSATDPGQGTEGATTTSDGASGEEQASAGDDTGAPDATPPDDASMTTPAEPETTPAEPAAPTGLQFETLAAKNTAAIERFRPIVERYGARPSGRLASYYLGICEAELGNTDAAIAALTQAVEADAPLISAMAAFRLGQLELSAGNPEVALQYFDGLIDRSDGLFPQEEALMAKARAHEEGGDSRAALAAYQRVMNEYSGTYAAVEARARAEELSAELGVELQEPGVPSG